MKVSGHWHYPQYLQKQMDLNCLKNYKQLVSCRIWCGRVAIGTRVGKTKISKKGNSRIRRALHMHHWWLFNVKKNRFRFIQPPLKNMGKMKSYIGCTEKRY
jgi:hypothetical protein